MTPLIYISGPYSSDPVDGTRAAIAAADFLWSKREIPSIVPHLSHLHHLVAPRSYEEWIRLDLALVERCDALWRLPGDSTGADIEMIHADDLGIKVFRGVLGPEMLASDWRTFARWMGAQVTKAADAAEAAYERGYEDASNVDRRDPRDR